MKIEFIKILMISYIVLKNKNKRTIKILKKMKLPTKIFKINQFSIINNINTIRMKDIIKNMIKVIIN